MGNPLLVPVTVTVNEGEVAEPLQDSVDVAVPPAGGVTLVGLSVQVRPVVGLTLAVSATAWLKVPCELTVIVDVPAAPASTVTVVGLAVRVKPAEDWTITVRVVELVMSLLVPPVPLSVTV